ncbi:alpha/beta hydrolase [Neorhodopirellula pilleata]|uniref:Carboxylesterase NlhH n=1 Tax=Neorhodopirellula pilleata TaxID=2714738 RepID=A0A5C5ZZC8_9BACT|nr:alpha/beta hydrolase fold domain-containing protein [Neorhodopirellula pilleata]TWT92649.1 Carboxylesterase NlhH [Neorhodopirellula pilleata]
MTQSNIITFAFVSLCTVASLVSGNLTADDVAVDRNGGKKVAKQQVKASYTPDEVIAYRTVEKADGTSDDLDLNMFYPPGHKASDKTPCIVFFFGGGWSGGSPSQFFPHCEYLSERGMVAISAEYRTKSSHQVQPKTCVFDGKSAVRWVREHATRLGIDPNHVAAGGGSAGGHVAAAIAACTKLEQSSEPTATTCLPNALVLFNPVYDNGPDGYGNERVKEYWEVFSPMHNIHSKMPPTIAFFGTEDNLIPVETTKAFGKAMQDVGVRYDNHLYEGQGHGFFNAGRSKAGTDYFVETVREADKFLASLGFLKGEPTISRFVNKSSAQPSKSK